MSLMLSQPPIDLTSTVRATSAFDPPVVRPGEPATYHVSFNALEESIQWPTNIAAPPALALRLGGHGQILRLTGTNYAPLTSFNARVRPSVVGEFTIPEFTVTIYEKPVTVPAARLVVMDAPAPLTPPAPQLLLELPGTNAVVGQALNARVTMPAIGSAVVQSLSQVQLTGEGLLVDQSATRPRAESINRAGTNYILWTYDLIFRPIKTGKLTLFAQGYAVGNRFGPVIVIGPGTVAGGPAQYTFLDSEPTELNVRPLPRQGELPGFTGGIGTFSMDRPRLETNVVKVGDPVKLSVIVRGDAGVTRLAAPPPPPLREWEIFPVHEPPPPQLSQMQGFTIFNYSLVPLSEQATSTPPIPFSFFDPRRDTYVDLTIPSVEVTIKPGAAPADLEALFQSGADSSNAEPELVLSGLAAAPGRAVLSLAPIQQQPWFMLIQLVPAGGIIGLLIWDRRRRFLEQHPDLVLRRRARRALRREWRAVRRAAQKADAPRFASAAVNAMRLACAPYFPAEPRALVGLDVLEIIEATPQDIAPPTREAVRKFFTVMDAARFGTSDGDVGSLLALQPQLEQVLQKLEERLCA